VLRLLASPETAVQASDEEGKHATPLLAMVDGPLVRPGDGPARKLPGTIGDCSERGPEDFLEASSKLASAKIIMSTGEKILRGKPKPGREVPPLRQK